MSGAVFYDLTPEELCDLMCGAPAEDEEEVDYAHSDNDDSRRSEQH